MIFLDVKFNGDPKNVKSLQPISIGLVSFSDRTFYAELTDTYRPEDCSDDIRLNVMPLLDAPALQADVDYENVYAKMTLAECSLHLVNWFNHLTGPGKLWTKSPRQDVSFIEQLLHGHEWPKGLLKSHEDCGDRLNGSGREKYQAIMSDLYGQGYRKNHALDDAKVLRLAIRKFYE